MYYNLQDSATLGEDAVGDTRITELELSHYHSYLQNNVEVKDRVYHFKTYKECFLGRYVQEKSFFKN